MQDNSFTWKERVRIYDTDIQGIVHYAGYYRFFTDTMEQFCRKTINISFPMLSDRIWLVVVESKASYHKPARLGNMLSTRLRAEMIGKKAVRFNFRIYSRRELMCEGSIVHVAIDNRKWRAVPVPEALKSAIERFESHRSRAVR